MLHLKTIMHYLHRNGKHAFTGTFEFDLNESRIKFNARDERYFDWQDDGNDVEIVSAKYTLPETGAKVDAELLKMYEDSYGCNIIEEFLDSAAIGVTVEKEMEELDELDRLHNEERKKDDQQTWKHLSNQFNPR